ncbi:MAG: DUF815 domain-containing protein [Butyribacter sp.]
MRIRDRAGEILEPYRDSEMCPDDLIGYESQKQKLIENTEAFVKGKRKQTMFLLFSDAGTGKSTSIKAILNKYYSQGLRMIEVYKP